jgi:hypothetical protein
MLAEASSPLAESPVPQAPVAIRSVFSAARKRPSTPSRTEVRVLSKSSNSAGKLPPDSV